MSNQKYFLDTNVWARLLLDQQGSLQKEVAEQILIKAVQGEYRLVISPTVLLELYYLITKIYGLSTSEGIIILKKLINSPVVLLSKSFEMKKVWNLVEEGISFQDALVCGYVPDKVPLVTFDVNLQKTKLLLVISPDHLLE